jgi:tetratricopeptide (TPR) repeat protein
MNEDEVITTVSNLKASARTSNQFGDHAAALSHLDRATTLLEALAGDWLKRPNESYEVPSHLVHPVDVAREYSDALGMRGGVLRRMGRDEEALAGFVAGSQFELDPRFGVMNSYATVNALKMTSLGDTPHSDELDVPAIDGAVEMLKHQIDGPRGQDRWAYADLGDCHLMRGDTDEAMAAYERFAELSTEGHLTSAYDVLVDLHEQLERRGDLRAAAVQCVVDFLDSQLESM